MRRTFALVVLAASAALAASPAAHADPCYGTSNTATACFGTRVVYSDCVYTGPPPCTPVVVTGPVCVYGGISTTYHYETPTC